MFAEWLKTTGYLDTKDQDKINYMFIPPKKETANEIPSYVGHFIRTEIHSAEFKKENLASKIRKTKTRKPYVSKEKTDEMPPKNSETAETIKILNDIATLEPEKNALLAAKKNTQKYKKLREANTRKQKYKIPGEIVIIKTVETPQGEVKVPVSIEKPKRSGKEAAKKIIKKYDKIRREKMFRKIVDANEKKKKNRKHKYHRGHKEFHE